MTRNIRHTLGNDALALNKVHIGDSRLLCKSLNDNSVATTITSPPYFDLKDYGSLDQIGFGQTYEQYITDLGEIFSEVHRATKADGSLWIVIDTFRRDREVLPLPFDLASKLKEAGWILRDIVIWKKDRTLPWSHPGTTRKIFEYILVFSKGRNEFRFDPDAHRSIDDLKKWWVRYPERYNPRGKSLEEVWTYDIPTQGSWGSEYIRHFCPLPEELVSRIIQITTAEGDVVFDPFSGSGTVPCISAKLRRAYLGFELNAEYVKMFEKHLVSQKTECLIPKKADLSVKDFEATILKLRVLKFGRLIVKALERLEIAPEKIRVFAFEDPELPSEKQKICRAKYVVVGSKARIGGKTLRELNDLISRPPFSKFGVQATVERRDSKFEIGEFSSSPVIYGYSKTNSHAYQREYKSDATEELVHPLLSPIGITVEEPIE